MTGPTARGILRLMHVYFVLYHRFDNASGIHIFHLANELQNRGIACTALVPDTPESVRSFGEPAFAIETFNLGWRSRIKQRLAKRGDSIVHAWTPREVTRRPTLQLAARLRAPYLIHLEDNERDIYLAHARRRRQGERGKRKISNRLIHPLRWRQFMRGAAGVTALVDDLLEFCPAGTPGQVFWPACEPAVFEMPTAPNYALRRSFGIPENALVLYYPGNVHAANVEDVHALYRAIFLLNVRGLPVWMVRTGTRSSKLPALPELPQIVELGHQPSSRVPEFLGVADILAQPGRADRFNGYRFPSKLPMFLASGRPVILPECNLGKHLSNGRNCLLTTDGTAEELCEKIALLAADPALRERLGTAGREFARENLGWEIAADRMVRFYQSILAAW